MALPTLPDNREDEKLNPGQKHYDENMGAGHISSGVDQAEAFANDPANSTAKNLSDAESQAGGAAKTEDDVRDSENAPGSWKNSTNGRSSKAKSNKFMTFAKKRGGLFAILAGLGVGGGLLASLLGPASMLINLMENASITNDSSSTVLEKRFLKVLGHATRTEDPICANKTNTLKCRMGKISNSALDKLVAKGVQPVFADEVDTSNRKKTGYPTKNPTHYVFEIDGIKSAPIPANELINNLRDNPKMAAKVLGRGGAFNLRLSNWGGRHITQQFLNKFGLKKDGGLADGKNGKMSAQERYKAAIEKMRSKIPGNEKLTGVTEAVKTKVGTHLNKAAKGGTGYMLAVAGCIGVKAPGYIAAGVAAVQLAQVMPFAMDLVLSPGSKAKASGVDTDNSITSEDMDTVGTVLNEKTPRESDGRLTSALDSQYLQAAIGVNTGKPAISQEYVPGYAILTSGIVLAARDADKASADACNVILSPAAMWSAFALDSAVTVAASATIIGGIVKVALSVGASAIIGAVAQEVAGEAAEAAVAEIAQNNKIPTAQGEALGDVTGIALSSFFSAGSAARNLPVMTNDQVAEFQETAVENEVFKKEMDIASLSPFDTSSKYTFLGSITNSIKLAVIGNGVYNGSFSSIVASVAKLPFASLSSNAGAANYTSNLCGYAAAFGLESGAGTPAITQAGTPCYGMTAQQLAMDTNQALTLTEDADYFDEENVIIDDSYNISDMVGTGVEGEATYIKADTPMSEFINSCSDLSTGDYVYNAAGCTVGVPGTGNSIEDKCYEGTDGAQICTTTGSDGVTDSTITEASQDQLAAISVTLVDFQVNQMLNGTDVGNGPDKTAPVGGTNPGGEGGTNTVKPEGAVDAKAGWTFAPYKDYSATPCDPRTQEYSASHRIIPNAQNSPATGAIIRLCAIPVPFSSGATNNGANLVASVVSTNVMNMLTAARNEGKMIRINDAFRINFSSGYVSQHTTGLSLDLGVDGQNTICRAGANAVTGWGSAANAETQCRRIGGAQYEAYKWLQANAAQYGFHNYEVEPWHWSTSGQ